jgi:hypothetical protein
VTEREKERETETVTLERKEGAGRPERVMKLEESRRVAEGL